MSDAPISNLVVISRSLEAYRKAYPEQKALLGKRVAIGLHGDGMKLTGEVVRIDNNDGLTIVKVGQARPAYFVNLGLHTEFDMEVSDAPLTTDRMVDKLCPYPRGMNIRYNTGLHHAVSPYGVHPAVHLECVRSGKIVSATDNQVNVFGVVGEATPWYFLDTEMMIDPCDDHSKCRYR